MNQTLLMVVMLWGGLGLAAGLTGLFVTTVKQQPFKQTAWLFPWGIFVWGDAPIIGLFWILTSVASILTANWWLFGFSFSLFWLVRAVGETIYWLNQQFSSINRNPPEKLLGHTWFPGDSIWFAYQVFWQCTSVLFLISSLYFGRQWLSHL